MVRSKNRRQARGRRILLMTLLIFCTVFLWPVLSDKIKQNTAAIPASAAPESQTSSETQAEAPTETSEKTETTQTSDIDAAKDSEYLLLINKENPLPKGYVPGDLQQVASSASAVNGQKMRAVPAAALEQLSKSAAQEGYTIKLVSGYRSYSLQKELYTMYVKQDGKYVAEQYSARPGYSEHQAGLAADVSSPSAGYDLLQSYGNTAEGKWLAKNAHRFGFIIRYLKGKEDITGYLYEPWHLRYVGTEAATEIYEQQLTLEEYLEKK